jgi:hypothetical protein
VQVDLSDLEGELLPLFPKGGFEKYKIISFYFNVFVCALVSIKNVWLAHQICYFRAFSASAMALIFFSVLV